jgi:hypothetical protein
MDHAKRMMVVSPEEFARFQEGARVSTGKLDPLDDEMTRIMNAKGVSDSEKWGLYKQVLQRFLHFANESRRPLKLFTSTVSDSGNEVNGDDVASGSMVDVIKEQTLAPIPKTYIAKARLLYDRLKSSDDSVISWDDRGTVSVHGVMLNGSSITDLVADTVRDRKSTNPAGVAEFSRVLTELNIPKEFIGDARRKAFIRGDSRNASATPVANRSVRSPLSSRWTPYTPVKKKRGRPRANITLPDNLTDTRELFADVLSSRLRGKAHRTTSSPRWEPYTFSRTIKKKK